MFDCGADRTRHQRVMPSFYLFILIVFVYLMSVLPACLSGHHVHTWSPWRSEEGIESLGAGVTDSCDSTCEC